MESEDESELDDKSTILQFKVQKQLPKDRKAIREKYLKLTEVALKEKEKDDPDPNVILKNMDAADAVYKNVCSVPEAVCDAKLLNLHGEIVKKKAHLIQTGSPFSASVFMRKLASRLNVAPPASDSDDFQLDQEAWLNLGNSVHRMFNRVPRMTFIQGTFIEPVAVVRQPRRVREKEAKTQTIEPKVVDAASQKAKTDKTYEEIQRIRKILCKLYEKKGTPVGYFEFTVDPTSFSRTIENMFHLAFLIKEREVHLSEDEHELPVIEPVLQDTSTTNEAECAQSILTMNVEKWQQLIDVFEIKEAAIPLPRSARGSRRG